MLVNDGAHDFIAEWVHRVIVGDGDDLRRICRSQPSRRLQRGAHTVWGLAILGVAVVPEKYGARNACEDVGAWWGCVGSGRPVAPPCSDMPE